MRRSLIAMILSITVALGIAGCNIEINQPARSADHKESVKEPEEAEETETPDKVDKNGETYILCTSDVHCGVDQGFGFAGLSRIMDTFESQGYEVILIDDGDAIQGELLGAITQGEAIIKLMNAVGYDVAIPGNHEFDYGMDRFLELTEKADFPYISCNFNHEGELVFAPYIIKEVNGIKIGFVGVTTPTTISISMPIYFMNESGEYVYDFMDDESGQKLYDAVQKAVDDARSDGADLIYIMAHLGNEASCEPWIYADVIAHTNGIDVFFDGHSHDSDIIKMKNKDGEEVIRVAVGTKMSHIGYSLIDAQGKINDTGSWNWSNKIPAPDLLDIRNDVRDSVDEQKAEHAKILNEIVGVSDVDLTINDPEEKNEKGEPIRMIRRGETNLGDFVADAYRIRFGSDVAIVNGGSIRDNVYKGDLTYETILNVHPFGSMLSKVEVTGQTILDALEWGAAEVPGESGGFLQVSGLTYEIDSSVDSTCTMDENRRFTGVGGDRRVKNVMIGDEALDPWKKYTLTTNNYILFEHGDGFTMFDDAKVIKDSTRPDTQILIDYIKEDLKGTIGEEYADPYGEGRIVIDQDRSN